MEIPELVLLHAFLLLYWSFLKFKSAKELAVSSRSQLLTTSFLNQTSGYVMNESDVEVKYNLCIGTKATEVVILPRAIQNISLQPVFYILFFRYDWCFVKTYRA
jgi:hypothetical protein